MPVRLLAWSALNSLRPRRFAQYGTSAACADPAYRQFDFWIGEWQVHTPDGKLAGTNRITRRDIADGDPINGR